MTMIRHGRRFIVKGLLPEYAARPEYRDLLRKEFNLAARLDHPSIVRVISFEPIGNYGECIVMEYVDGLTLDKYLAGKPVLSERMRIAADLADALEYIHSLGVSHRDLKPDNIMITRRGGRVVIIDFGLGDSQDYAILKKSSATLSYGAPEQLTRGEADSRADIYSLGLIFRDLRLPLSYRPTISRMLRHDPDKRPSIKDVIASITTANKIRSRMLPVLVAACAVIVSIVLLRATYSPGSPVAMPTSVGESPTATTSDSTANVESIQPAGQPTGNVTGTARAAENKDRIINAIYNEELNRMIETYNHYSNQCIGKTTYYNGHCIGMSSGQISSKFVECSKKVSAIEADLEQRLLDARIDKIETGKIVSAFRMASSRQYQKSMDAIGWDTIVAREVRELKGNKVD